jgi:hypothetical protein
MPARRLEPPRRVVSEAETLFGDHVLALIG